jgi:hypothetical protein
MRWTFFVYAPLLFCICNDVREQEKPGKGADKSAEIKKILNERHQLMWQLLREEIQLANEVKYDFSNVGTAQREALRATLDLEQSPEKRVNLLKELKESAERVVKMAENRMKAGVGRQVDVLRSRAILLEIRVELLREEQKAKAAK